MVLDVRPGRRQRGIVKMRRLDRLQGRVRDQERQRKKHKIVVSEEPIQASDPNCDSRARKNDT